MQMLDGGYRTIAWGRVLVSCPRKVKMDFLELIEDFDTSHLGTKTLRGKYLYGKLYFWQIIVLTSELHGWEILGDPSCFSKPSFGVSVHPEASPMIPLNPGLFLFPAEGHCLFLPWVLMCEIWDIP